MESNLVDTKLSLSQQRVLAEGSLVAWEEGDHSSLLSTTETHREYFIQFWAP